MRTNIAACAALVLVAFPVVASAHQISTYKIGNWYYSVTVGYLNEPAVIDQANALDISVRRCKTGPCFSGANDKHIVASLGNPVLGLDSTMTLEVGLGSATKEIPLQMQPGTLGRYTAVYIPTETGLYTYHLSGRIDNVPVDLAYGCRPVGKDEMLDDASHVALAYGVTRLSESGAVECPIEKTGLEFPASASAMPHMQADISRLRIELALTGIAALGAFLLSVYLWWMRRS